MDAQQVFATDRKKFETDLECLIDTAAAAVLTGRAKPSAARLSTPQSSQKRRVPQTAFSNPAKKIKLNEELTNIHPSRIQLLRSHPSEESRVSNVEHLSSSHGTGTSRDEVGQPATVSLRSAVQRQWTNTDDITYEELLDRRRSEVLVDVDRYVPSTTSLKSYAKSPPNKRSKKAFPYSKLPKEVRDKILSHVLIIFGPIIIDFTWLRPFVNGHSRVPSACRFLERFLATIHIMLLLRFSQTDATMGKTVVVEGSTTYSGPLEWKQLTQEVEFMQRDCSAFHSALEIRGNKTRRLKAPCRGMTTGLLRVSKEVHKQAASIFYGQNTFHFPCATSSWMQLESFLATIGPTNAAHLSKLRTHAPLWHRGIHENFLEGAILDLTSPASRLGVVTPTQRDRLLSAIRSSLTALARADKLTELSFDLEHGMVTDRWTGRYINERQLISTVDAEEYITRKQHGIQLLKEACRTLKLRPVLTLCHPSASNKISKRDRNEFKIRFQSVVKEAEKYDWQVDSHLGGRRW